MAHAAGDTGWVAWTNGVDTSVAANTSGVAANVTAIASTTATANAAIPATQKGAASGVATLDAGSLIPIAQIPPGLPGATMGTPTASAAQGTSTTSTTEVRDAVLGNYTFTAVAGRRYRAIVDGLTMYSTVAADVAVMKIRNGGASTPTTASTVVATAYSTALSPASYMGYALSNTFAPGAGVVTLSLFYLRAVGTGVLQTGASFRELYVVDLGPA